jgi:phosphoribosylamine--glycine ligase/phosphoribosylformylglycinamidine cyclo-ligase
VLALSDGSNIAVLPAAQADKRALDGGEGPTTDGMGAFAPTPAVSPEMMERIRNGILQRTIDGLKSEGRPYVGCLLARLTLTKNGPQVLGFGCTFGDPEAQAILPLVDCDFHEILSSCVQGRLSAAQVKVLPQTSAVSVVLTSGG